MKVEVDRNCLNVAQSRAVATRELIQRAMFRKLEFIEDSRENNGP